MIYPSPPPPTPENAYVVLHNALVHVNEKISPGYRVVILGQVDNKEFISGPKIRETRMCNPVEPLMLEIVQIKTTAKKTWDWCRSFLVNIPPAGARLGVVNVVTSRQGNELRKVDIVAKTILRQVKDYQNINRFIRLENGTLINKEGAEDLKIANGKVFINDVPINTPAIVMFSEEPMVFKSLENGWMSLGSPNDVPFYFHHDKLTEEGELTLFRKIDRDC